MRVQMYSASNFISFDVHADLKLLDHIVLQKPVLEKPLTTLGALENSGLLHSGLQLPEELTLQALSPKQKGCRTL